MAFFNIFNKKKETAPENKLGLVLSGGGIRALAHAGLLQALEERGIQPDCIAGTSGGALIAALYASGYKPKEMMNFFKDTPVFSFSLFALNKPGLVDSEKYQVLFEKFFTKTTFEELNIPITVTATNLNTGKLEFFDSGDLIKPLLASCALPPYFSPVKINDHLYSDGGLLNNFPYEPLCDTCQYTLGSFVNPVAEVENKDINNTFKLLQRVITISMDANYYHQFNECHYVFLPPEIYTVGILDVKMLDRAFEIGYEHAIKEMPTILKILGEETELLEKAKQP
ncbi:patatin-like phospholipase family protein [Neptunitalea lumnitzerae]|uniref:Patatin n=1 Tax=Neptunitalea lumnitzerae TaxID=2965509 RepID=A0ABQ5MGE2_9FLAO|nr:patatin-like phospholipase family protein [Neptunitalea sp. Y10]GLB48453.1 patatin [Neptunitalea sp. Y10]